MARKATAKTTPKGRGKTIQKLKGKKDNTTKKTKTIDAKERNRLANIGKATQFQKGHEFWRNVDMAKIGRDRLFPKAVDLWNAVLEYFQWNRENPWIKNELVKGGMAAGEIMEVPTERPLSIMAFCVHQGCSQAWWTVRRKQLLAMEEEKKLSGDDATFLKVMQFTEDACRTQKFEGAAVGAFNANFIARDLGMGDKIETEITDKKAEVKKAFPTEEEMREQWDRLED